MAEHTATITWSRGNDDFLDKRYHRAHTWQFDGGATVAASSSPHVVPLPYSDAAAVDPEEAYVAALSSCHMLTFLSIAALRKLVVDRYEDDPRAELGKNEKGKMMIAQITLRPRVTFGGTVHPDAAALLELHRKAKENCFVGNSLLTRVLLEPRD